jgi:hypothetical protein
MTIPRSSSPQTEQPWDRPQPPWPVSSTLGFLLYFPFGRHVHVHVHDCDHDLSWRENGPLIE